jgi:hypothetical protein
MDDSFVPAPMRRQGKMISVLQFVSVTLMGLPFIGVLVKEGWPLSSDHWRWATMVGAGIMMVLIETRLAELLNEAQEVNWLLRSIVKEPSAEDLRPGDILRIRRAILGADRQGGM